MDQSTGTGPKSGLNRGLNRGLTRGLTRGLKMGLLAVLLAALAGIAVWGGVGLFRESAATESYPVVVYVSLPPQASLVRQIGGPHVVVHTLVAAGQDPHLFEPAPRQLRSLAAAHLYLTIGMPFEQPVLQKIRGHLPKMRVVDSTAGLTRLPGVACTHDHHHVSEGGTHVCSDSDGDPHVWLSPEGLRTMAKHTAESLAALAPDHADEFMERLGAVHVEIDRADAAAAAILEPHRGRTMYVFHPAFGYFCEAYGLRQKAVEVDDKSPSTRQLRELIHQAKEDRATVVFIQAQFDQHAARAVAKALDARLVEIDPLAEDAVAHLESLAKTIASALEESPR
ncbi:MAG TPA: ABC transporter substrate-binding protein [Planctomycetaceae bacterium]|nr:ABC transporter substrate-binding protein [Planctomycetaceae bacterium]